MSLIQEGNLSPVVLAVLLHVHYLAEPVEDCGSNTAALAFLSRNGLITVAHGDAGGGSGWKTTARGRAHVTQLCQHPFPVPMDGWMNPITKQALT